MPKPHRMVHLRDSHAWIRKMMEATGHFIATGGVGCLFGTSSGHARIALGSASWTPITHGRGTVILLVARAHQHLVLKIGMSGPEMDREVHAVAAFSGRGAIHVVDYDHTLPAVLLERAGPGIPLSSVDDDDHATGIFCFVVRQLHPSPGVGPRPLLEHHFSAIRRYQEIWCSGTGPLPMPGWSGRWPT